MSVFANSIAADQHIPSEGDGYVRAEAIQEAVALVGQPAPRSPDAAATARIGKLHRLGHSIYSQFQPKGDVRGVGGTATVNLLFHVERQW